MAEARLESRRRVNEGRLLANIAPMKAERPVDRALPQPSKIYPDTFDFPGNVGQLVTLDSGTSVEEPENPVLYLPAGESAARYEYDPFGGTLVASDDAGLNNPFRYSTKYYGDQLAKSAAGERGLYYYGYRYYSPRLGRWVNRDPIGVSGGFNLLSFVTNNAFRYYYSGHPCLNIAR